MKALLEHMKLFCLLVIALLSCVDSHAQQENETVEEGFMGPYSITAWGQHRSNTLDHTLGNLLLRGGFIDRELVDAARLSQGSDMGTFGASAGAIWKWRSNRKWKDTEARICGSFQARALVDARWTPELFELVFKGNAGHLGRFDVLDGSRLRATAWATAAVGLEGRNKNRLELGLVYRRAQLQGQIHTGYFLVNAETDTLYASMRADARYDARGGVGLALNGEWHFIREEAPFAFHVQIQNWGWVVVPGGGGRYALDTLIETTGLAWDGPGWSLETLQEPGFGDDFLSIDTAGVSVQRLPGRMDVAVEYPLSPRSGMDVALHVGEWMPLPRVMLGYRRAIGQQWQIGVQGIIGGWGRLRPAGWVRWRVPEKHAFMLFLEDPWGWGSSSAFGRGLTLRFEAL